MITARLSKSAGLRSKNSKVSSARHKKHLTRGRFVLYYNCTEEDKESKSLRGKDGGKARDNTSSDSLKCRPGCNGNVNCTWCVHPSFRQL